MQGLTNALGFYINLENPEMIKLCRRHLIAVGFSAEGIKAIENIGFWRATNFIEANSKRTNNPAERECL